MGLLLNGEWADQWYDTQSSGGEFRRQHIVDFPAISHYLRELYQHPGVAQTVNFDHIKQHYYGSHVIINPTQVVPVGPDQDFTLSHNLDRFDRKQ